MEIIRKNKGITLIALVITIIILLILAGISIATLTGENGLLTKANIAKEKTQKASAKEQAQIDIAAYLAEQTRKGESTELNDSIIKTILTGKDYVKGNPGDTSFISKEGEYEIAYSDLYNKNEPPIPKGFYHAGGTIEEGFVISDVPEDDLDNTRLGNQFVWIPVPDIKDFHPIEGYSADTLDNKKDDCSEPFEDGYEGEKTDYDNMYQSVERNHGFYIGRYEAGKDAEGNAKVKRFGGVAINMTWGNSMTDIEKETGAVKLAKDFSSNNGYTSVTSTLCYGVQWDATMQFFDSNYIKGECEEDSYVRNSTGKGWYNSSGSIGNRK